MTLVYYNGLLPPTKLEVGQTWKPTVMGDVVASREIVEISPEGSGFKIVTYRPLGRDYGRTHKINAADFALWVDHFRAYPTGVTI